MDEQARKQIAQRFAAARKQRKMTQQDVADAAGVSLGMINNLENGRSMPQSANRAAIVEALGVDVFGEGLAESARRGWPESVQTFTDVLGQYLSTLPAEERHALITAWMKEILRPR